MNRTLLPWLALLVASVSAFATTYEIESANGLRNLNACTASDTIKLTRSINMEGPSFVPLCPDGFYGVFDGGDSAILKLNIVASMKTYPNMAFIAILGDGGVLKNVTFQDANIVAYQEGNGGVKGASVAVAVGKLEGGSVENVHVKGGNVSISLGSNSTGDAGGLAGTADSGSISGSDGNVSVGGSNGANVGGICGSVTGDVTLTSVSYTGTSDVDIAGSGMEAVTIVNKYGALTVTEKNSVRTVDIDGNYMGTDAVEIPTDIEVNSVTLNRTFTKNVLSSLFLPFSIRASQISGATKIYKFNRVAKNDEGIWKVKVSSVTELTANTPYMVLPSADGKLTFNIDNPVAFNTTTGPETHSVINDTWEFKGVYAHVDFDADFPDVSRVYGFAAQAADGYNAGDFVKVGVGADIPAMRAYLVHHSAPLQKSRAGVLGQSVIPDVIEIEVEDETGLIVGTGKLNTVTGEVRMDRWFDLKGRKLNSEPIVKGTYYKNGKKAIIK